MMQYIDDDATTEMTYSTHWNRNEVPGESRWCPHNTRIQLFCSFCRTTAFSEPIQMVRFLPTIINAENTKSYPDRQAAGSVCVCVCVGVFVRVCVCVCVCVCVLGRTGVILSVSHHPLSHYSCDSSSLHMLKCKHTFIPEIISGFIRS